MKEMAKKNQQLRAGEILIIVVVLFMWAGQSNLSVKSVQYPWDTPQECLAARGITEKPGKKPFLPQKVRSSQL